MSIKVGKSFKALIAAGAALVMAASMAACGPSAGTPSEAKSSDTGTSSSANAKARSLDEIKKSGKIKIAVFSDKAPFGYVDKDGKYQGYDVYFAEQLAKDLGVEPEYTSVDPAARVDVLTSNKVDLVLANFTVTDERKEKVDFAKPYMKVALGVVSPESAQITDVSQLDGKTLIIAKGTTAETWFEKNAPNVKLQKYDQYADAYNALLDGRGDAFSTDNTEVLAWAKSNKGFKVGITHLGDDDTIAPAVQKGNTELLDKINEVLQKLMDYYAYERRGIRLLRMEDTWQLCSAPDYADVIRKAFEIRKPAKLSQPALEVLTIIAYYQPTTRAYVDQIRGVDSAYTIGLLLDRKLIEECGRLQVPGRPRLYRTTKQFLRAFHLTSLDDLPELPDLGGEGQMRIGEDGQIMDPADTAEITGADTPETAGAMEEEAP